MGPVEATNLRKRLIKQGITGFTTFAFLMTQLAWPLSAFARNNLRQEPPPENKSGLEELAKELQSASQGAPTPLQQAVRGTRALPHDEFSCAI